MWMGTIMIGKRLEYILSSDHNLCIFPSKAFRTPLMPSGLNIRFLNRSVHAPSGLFGRFHWKWDLQWNLYSDWLAFYNKAVELLAIRQIEAIYRLYLMFFSTDILYIDRLFSLILVFPSSGDEGENFHFCRLRGHLNFFLGCVAR